MNATTRGAGPGSRDRFPHCRVVWDADGAEVSVWVANGDEPGWVRRQRIEVIEAVAGRAFEHVRDAAPGAEMAVDAVEVLQDHRTIVSLTIAALVQVAAVHAGIPVPAAKLIGDAAGKLGRGLLNTESGGDRDPAVRYVDFDYDTDTDRTRPEEPGIRRADRASGRDAVGELLDPHRRDRGTRAGVATRASPGLSRVVPKEGPPPRAARAETGTARPIPPARPRPAARDSRLRGVTRKQQPGSRGGRGGPGDR